MEKQIILERLQKVTKEENVSWEMRYIHHTTHQIINGAVLKVLEEIVGSDDFEKKLEEKLIECTLKKIELESISKELNQ
jgi:adenosine deaminase